VLIETWSSPAWWATTHGAKILYIALKRRFNQKNHNNGRIYLSLRTAMKELRSHHNQIASWFRELQHYGFIVRTSSGYLGLEGRGRAPTWRLTELGYQGNFPTKDYLKWNGTKFDAKAAKMRTRTGNSARSVSENRHTSVPDSRTKQIKTAPENQHKESASRVPEKARITSLPYHCGRRRERLRLIEHPD
jgi:hypothetical protein